MVRHSLLYGRHDGLYGWVASPSRPLKGRTIGQTMKEHTPVRRIDPAHGPPVGPLPRQVRCGLFHPVLDPRVRVLHHGLTALTVLNVPTN